jgi:branched-chain amino acid transport system ATP-binding protein
MVRRVADEGTTVVLVEQSVNVALTMASTAVFMERGRVRYSGPAQELLARPDLLRAVFLAGDGAPAHAELSPSGNGSVPSGNGTRSRPALRLEGVTRRFGGISAVEDVTIDVGEHEIVGLIGQNGAGKTTLLDLICGYQQLDGGRILLGGDDMSSMAPHLRARAGLGRTFQGGRLSPGLTVAETVAVALEQSVVVRDLVNPALYLPAAYDSEAAVARRVDELLDLFGISAYRESFTAELSTGTRRIVEFACAVAHQPRILLLDEPASGVAQREVEQLGELLLRIRRELGCAMVVIEHDMPLVAAVSDRLVALEAGEVIAQGPSAEVLADPRVIASYLGDDLAAVHRSGVVGGGGGPR